MSNSIEDELKEYCAELGDDPLLVQGAGGNASWKLGDVLWIKASGTQLREARVREIFVPVDLKALLGSLATGDPSISPVILNGSCLRPSIETLLHAVMPQTIVIHLHAVELLAILVQDNCREQLSARLKNAAELQWDLIEYCKPGAALAESVSASLLKNPKIQILFLQNHGLVIGGQSVSEVDFLLEKVLGLCASSIVQRNITIPTTLELSLDYGYRLAEDKDLNALVFNRDLFDAITACWALYPDHVVFLGGTPVIFDSKEDFLRTISKISEYPKFIFIKDYGVYVRDTFSKAQLIQLRCYFDVMMRLDDLSRINSLAIEKIEELLDWDAEKYRQSLQDS